MFLDPHLTTYQSNIGVYSAKLYYFLATCKTMIYFSFMHMSTANPQCPTNYYTIYGVQCHLHYSVTYPITRPMSSYTSDHQLW